MKLFGNKEAAPMMQTGTDVLRDALRARNKGAAFALIARDLGIGTAALEAFAHGQGKLPAAILDTLAKRFFGDNCAFDAEANLLRRAKTVATSIGVGPPRFVPKAPPVLGPSGWPPIISDKPQSQPQQMRPGWAAD